MNSSKKALSVMAVLLMLFGAFFIPVTATDAEERSLPYADIDPEDIEDEALQEVLDKLVELLNVIRGEAHIFDFTSDVEENRQKIHDFLEEAAAELEMDLPEDEIKKLTNYLGVIPMVLLATTMFDPVGDIDIGEGSLKVAVGIPDFLIELLKNEGEQVELGGFGEMGILMDVHSDINVRATDDVERIGVFGSGLITALNNALGSYSNIAKNLIVCDDLDMLKARPVSIGKDSEYAVHTDTNLAIYSSFETNTNLHMEDGESKFVSFNICLHIRGSISNEMERISGTGPQTIKTELDFNSTDIDFVFGMGNLNSKSRDILVGVDKISMDVGYSSDIDGEVKSCSVRNSGVLSIANGILISREGSEGSGDVPVPIYVPDKPEPRPPGMDEIINSAKEQAITVQKFDPTTQYMVGGALAGVAVLLIAIIRFGKKY